MGLEEQDLMTRAQKGDLDAFSALVIRHQSSVRATLAVRLHDRHEADDLAQEAFIVAYRKLRKFDTDKAFGPWIRSKCAISKTSPWPTSAKH
jgi:RNA polymerase sigma-70 factor (ECF subfamily)